MSNSLRRCLLPGMFLCAAAVCFGQVAPTTIIEVGDGNTFPEAPINCDWNVLNGSANADTTTTAAQCGAGGATISAYSFRVGGVTQNRFTQGSKDNQHVEDWNWDSNGSPDKNALTHGYAISYRASNGHKILAFGAERFAVNGDANIGIWFFQKEVKPVAGGTFSGTHTNGDVFAVSAFTGGGGHPNLDVYTWDTTCSAPNYPSPAAVGACSETNFRLLFSGSGGGLCGSSAGCATVNTANIDISWPYQAKFGLPGNTVPPNGFFEGGFDLTAIFPSTDVPCFSNFMIDTRTSQSVSASTKDFLAGSFPECSIEVVKDCQCTGFDAAGPNSTNNSGYNYGFNGQVTAKGGTLYNVTVTDQGKTYDCGSLAAGVPKSFGGATAVATATDTQCAGPAGTFSDDVFPTSNQATASGKTSQTGGTTLTAQTNVVSCSTQNPAGACTPNPQLTVDKQCVTALQVQGSNVVVRVDYTGKVYNNGNVNLGSVVVTEDNNAAGVDATFTIGTLAALSSKCYTNGQATCPALSLPSFNASTVTGAASYFPDSGTGVNPGRVQFTDKVRATGINPFGRATVESHPAGGGYSATCEVCPYGACPTTPPQ